MLIQRVEIEQNDEFVVLLLARAASLQFAQTVEDLLVRLLRVLKGTLRLDQAEQLDELVLVDDVVDLLRVVAVVRLASQHEIERIVELAVEYWRRFSFGAGWQGVRRGRMIRIKRMVRELVQWSLF